MKFYGTGASDFSDSARTHEHFIAMHGGDGTDFLSPSAEDNGQTNDIDGGHSSDIHVFWDFGTHGEMSGGSGKNKLSANAGADDLYGGRATTI